ncbi:prephenate dehydratase [Desulfovibrio litoralis]|uniref:Bifunctional chorismate mutase/prephenate dehydratase n=1 Tax=Desulfovibrio litoralis DSM 11393 TaxID=1121455 RepID=A0A1M7S8D4_9BACT|nr:prephenate dehydratase [Desulfovibrio litoralis]SHN54703.1 chorismate mutase / prephenate dehydratase [Desulfovibrio litoralis DSM 11393]
MKKKTKSQSQDVEHIDNIELVASHLDQKAQIDKLDNLNEVRNAIDQIDEQLLTLLNQRALMSLAVGSIKAKQREKDGLDAGTGGQIFHPERERAVLDHLTSFNLKQSGLLPNAHIHAIWREIFSSSRSLQAPQTVVCLGPEGTFSHAAVLSCFGQSVNVSLKPDFETVFRAVYDRQASFGLIPLENSLHGSVGQNFDLFLRYPVKIIAEIYTRIHLCLLSKEVKRKQIKEVHSHPQPLAQCDSWLTQHLPGVVRIPAESTAAAAKRILDIPNAGAIASRCLADMLGLNIVDEGIEDMPDNWTRFVVISLDAEQGHKAYNQNSIDKNLIEPPLIEKTDYEDKRKNIIPQKEGMKTSVLFTTKHKPGALSFVLNGFAEAGINLVKLESRPSKGEQWEYVFFADLSVDLTLDIHSRLRNYLDQHCATWRILGVYPAAQNKYII